MLRVNICLDVNKFLTTFFAYNRNIFKSYLFFIWKMKLENMCSIKKNVTFFIISPFVDKDLAW